MNKRIIKIYPLQESWPNRSPVAVVENIKHIIKGKRVCDIGCGKGDLLALMSQYANSVYGVESCEQEAKFAKDRGIEVYNKNIFNMALPRADVYYLWPGSDMEAIVDLLLNSMSGGFLIIMNCRKENEHILDSIKHPMEKRCFSFEEERCIKTSHGFTKFGEWCVGIINVPNRVKN